MAKEIINVVGTSSQDNLIAHIEPRTATTGILIAQLAADSEDVTLRRGTVLGVDASGKASIYGGSAEAKTAKFSGDGTTTTFTLSDKPESVDGVKVGDADATISSYNAYTGVVTLSAAPAAGTDNVVVSYSLSSGSTPAYILAEDVVVTDSADAPAVAYRCGCFNRNAVIVGEDYALTVADYDALRKYGIIFSDMLD